MRILRGPAARDKTGDSRSQQYDLMARGLYPRNVPLSAKARGWVDDELEALNQARVAARDLNLRGEARDAFIRQALAKRDASNGGAHK